MDALIHSRGQDWGIIRLRDAQWAVVSSLTEITPFQGLVSPIEAG